MWLVVQFIKKEIREGEKVRGREGNESKKQRISSESLF